MTLIYAGGSRSSVGVLEAIDEICKREDVVDVLAQDDTASSLDAGSAGAVGLLRSGGTGGPVATNSQTFVILEGAVMDWKAEAVEKLRDYEAHKQALDRTASPWN